MKSSNFDRFNRKNVDSHSNLRKAYFMKSKLTFIFLSAFLVLVGAEKLFAEELTLGLVQSRVKKGMSQGEVAQAIGSPNIASKDRDGSETWIYDKVSSVDEVESGTERNTEVNTEGNTKNKESGFSVGGGLIGSVFGALGGALGGFGSSQGEENTKEKTKVNTQEATKTKRTTSKKTLTVVIKFDGRSMVKDVSYHMSKF